LSGKRTLVLGVGNPLRCDDGVGIHVARMVHDEDPGIDVHESATAGLEILEAMKGYTRVIIVDAITTGAAPGSISLINLTRGEKPPELQSSHGIDLLTTLRLGEELAREDYPSEVVLLAVEAEDTLTLSERCTPRVEASILSVVEVILKVAHVY
jgi:hydrogenase maturation protease